jgi:hypothetical protein
MIMIQNRIAEYLPRSWRTKPGQDQANQHSTDIASYLKPANEFIAQHPGPCLAAAFALGVAVAWWIKRK